LRWSARTLHPFDLSPFPVSSPCSTQGVPPRFLPIPNSCFGRHAVAFFVLFFPLWQQLCFLLFFNPPRLDQIRLPQAILLTNFPIATFQTCAFESFFFVSFPQAFAVVWHSPPVRMVLPHPPFVPRPILPGDSVVLLCFPVVFFFGRPGCHFFLLDCSRPICILSIPNCFSSPPKRPPLFALQPHGISFPFFFVPDALPLQHLFTFLAPPLCFCPGV